MAHLSILRVEQEEFSFLFLLDTGDRSLQVSRPSDQVAAFLQTMPAAMQLSTLTGEALCGLFSNLLSNERTQLQTVSFLDDQSNPFATLHCRRVLDQMEKIQSSLDFFGTRICGLEDQIATTRRLIERLVEQQEEVNSSSEGEFKEDRTHSTCTIMEEFAPAGHFLCDQSVHSSDCSTATVESDISSSLMTPHTKSSNQQGFSYSPPDPQLLLFQKLREELISLDVYSGRFDEEVHRLLVALQTPESQYHWHQYMLGFVRKRVRSAIHCSLVETSLHEIGCAMPDDALTVSVLLNKGQVATWHLSLCEKLAMACEPRDPSPPRLGSSATDREVKIANIKCVAAEGGHRVRFTVNDTAVEVSINQRSPLCFAAFLGEMDLLVGGNGLFKQSLLLVRAWWQYCSSAFVNRRIAHYLPWEVLGLMVCTVFNLYHRQIHSPLQALLYFLAEFSGMDCAHHVITLNGIVVHSDDSHPLTLPPLSPYHLLGRDTVEKYWQLFHLGGAAEAMPSTGLPPTAAFHSRVDLPSHTTATRQAFDKRGFGVLHPFTHQSMLSHHLSSRRVAAIQQALRGGAMAMKAALSMAFVTGENLRDVLPQLQSTLQALPRREGSADWTTDREMFDRRAITSNANDRVWQNILFANFVLEQVVSESAILTATIEALGMRGPLPVGEVGKILTEVSGMPHLSLHLKEKFGGLKKFLEKFPELFVFSNDHPFNPHVVLRSTLGGEVQRIIYRGVIPMQIMAQYKKVSEKKKAKASKAAVPSAEPSSSAAVSVAAANVSSRKRLVPPPELSMLSSSISSSSSASTPAMPPSSFAHLPEGLSAPSSWMGASLAPQQRAPNFPQHSVAVPTGRGREDFFAQDMARMDTDGRMAAERYRRESLRVAPPSAFAFSYSSPSDAFFSSSSASLGRGLPSTAMHPIGRPAMSPSAHRRPLPPPSSFTSQSFFDPSGNSSRY